MKDKEIMQEDIQELLTTSEAFLINTEEVFNRIRMQLEEVRVFTSIMQTASSNSSDYIPSIQFTLKETERAMMKVLSDLEYIVTCKSDMNNANATYLLAYKDNFMFDFASVSEETRLLLEGLDN